MSMQAFELKNMHGEPMGIVETDAPEEEVQQSWTLANAVEIEDPLGLCINILEQSGFLAARLFTIELTP